MTHSEINVIQHDETPSKERSSWLWSVVSYTRREYCAFSQQLWANLASVKSENHDSVAVYGVSEFSIVLITSALEVVDMDKIISSADPASN